MKHAFLPCLHRGGQGLSHQGRWRWEVWLPGLVLALCASALRLALILRYPLLYDEDAYGRWLNRAHPFDSPWVPLFQLCLYVLTRLADSILAVRLLAALFGVTAVLAFWVLLRRAFGPVTAFLGALSLAFNPLFLVFTIVPYQEGLFLTLAFLALWLLLLPGNPRWFWLALIIGLAALTRYEGWLLALLFWFLLLLRRWRVGSLNGRFVAGSALALAWAPLLWIVSLRNVSPVGVQTLSPTIDPASLLTTLSTLWPVWSLNLGVMGGILTLGGLLWLGWRAARGSGLAGLLLAFLVGDVFLIAFLRPFSVGNLREPLLSLPVVLTGIAGLVVEGGRFLWYRLGEPSLWLKHQRLLQQSLLVLMTVLLFLWLVPDGVSRVAAYDALVRPASVSAEALPRVLPPDASVAVMGNPTEAFAFIVYANQIGWHGQLTELSPAVENDPSLLAAALSQAHARLLILYSSEPPDAATVALVRIDLLQPAGMGPGYTFWLIRGLSLI
jgi:hypothetical protein